MDRSVIFNEVKRIENEYKHFMGITTFPPYTLSLKEISALKADLRGYESTATAYYDFHNNCHAMQLSSNLLMMRYIVFHEFTHILDFENIDNKNKIAYMSITGYTEYHASQVELMQLLGANFVGEIICFSMNDNINTLLGNTSVLKYIQEKQNLAVQLFSRNDFPADLETLKIAIGVLFNYWGLRSICKMYAADYSEEVRNDSFLHFISEDDFNALDILMKGWLEKNQIAKSCILYMKIISHLISKYKLS